MMLLGSIWTFTGGDRVLFLRNTNPINYDLLCKQMVTVYRKEGEEYIRKVYDKAFLDHKKTQTVDKTGSKDANSFLLVIPGAEQTVFPGDKIFDGVGPEITDRETWATFIPSQNANVVVVGYADPKKWNGEIVHTEAGG